MATYDCADIYYISPSPRVSVRIWCPPMAMRIYSPSPHVYFRFGLTDRRHIGNPGNHISAILYTAAAPLQDNYCSRGGTIRPREQAYT